MQLSQSDTQVDWPASDFGPALDSLADAHYAVIPDFLSANMQSGLLNELQTYEQEGLFHAAGIGRGAKHERNTRIRGDRICWLESDFGAGGQYLARMDVLRQQLNQCFYLGLHSFEAHYAHYQAGNVYQRHVDRHRDNDARVVSAVCYLNPDWPVAGGGELKLYSPADELVLTLPPRGGTLVLFMSADMPHEVLAAQQSRYSIAGWFRRD